jgi:hypothetical protein
VILGVAGVAPRDGYGSTRTGLLVASNIVWTAWRLLQRTTTGLMDGSLPPEQHALVLNILERYRALGIDYHALRTRESGARRFISLHVLVPGVWTIDHGHQLPKISNARYVKRCRIRRYLPISNHWMIQPHRTISALTARQTMSARFFRRLLLLSLLLLLAAPAWPGMPPGIGSAP